MRAHNGKHSIFLAVVTILVTLAGVPAQANICEILTANGGLAPEQKDRIIADILVQGMDAQDAVDMRSEYSQALHTLAILDDRPANDLSDEDRMRAARAILWNRPWVAAKDKAIYDVQLSVAVKGFSVSADSFKRSERIEAAKAALKSVWIGFDKFSSEDKAEVETRVCQVLDLGCKFLFKPATGSRPYWMAPSR